MMSGSVWTERKARTGELTPPTRSFSARAKISRERGRESLVFVCGAVMGRFSNYFIAEALSVGSVYVGPRVPTHKTDLGTHLRHCNRVYARRSKPRPQQRPEIEILRMPDGAVHEDLSQRAMSLAW